MTKKPAEIILEFSKMKLKTKTMLSGKILTIPSWPLRSPYFLVLVVFIILLLPYLIRGEDVYLPVTDNMDSNLAWWKTLKDQGLIWSEWNTTVEGMLIENPRFTFPSGWNLEAVLYYLFPIWIAYAFHKFLILFFGMFAMLFWIRSQDHLNPSLKMKIALALLWATLSNYIHIGISMAALPMVVGVFQRLLKDDIKWTYFFLLLLYIFYSKLFLAGMYYLPGLFVWFLCFSIRNRRVSWPSLAALVLLGLGWLVQEKNMIRGLFFNPGFHSHREEFSYDFGIWVNQWPWEFIWSGDQNGIHYSPLYLILCVFFLLVADGFEHKSRLSFIYFRLVLGISLVLSILSFSDGLALLGSILPVLASLNLLRFEYWIPFLLFASFYYAWQESGFRGRKILVPFLLIVNIFVYQYEWRYWINDSIPLLKQRVPTFKGYYAQQTYGELKEYLREDISQKRFIHFNIPPAVSSFNGLNCFDGYFPVYNRSHKTVVYQVIKNELKKDVSLQKHFLEWGNKCYFQNAQYPDDYFMYKWRDEPPLMEPDYDYQYLKEELQVDYVLSALPVVSKKLKLLKVFENKDSAWRIHLYELK